MYCIILTAFEVRERAGGPPPRARVRHGPGRLGPELVDRAARTGAARAADAAASARGARGPRAVGCVFLHVKTPLLKLLKPLHDK